MAAPPELLWQVPPDLASGSGAGRLQDPRGIAASPLTGDVFVADRGGARIVEFSPWGEFVKAWGWGVRNGAPEPQTCGPGATPPSAGCLPGIDGVGPGQLHRPHGLAVDPVSGDVYVAEAEQCTEGLGCEFQNFRVQKFEPDGDFVWMVGGEVNKSKTAEGGSSEAERNLCTAASSDVCGIGTIGTGAGQFSNRSDLGFIAVGADGTVFVGDVGRIEEFNPDGTFKGQVVGALAGEQVRSLARDDDGNFYVTFSATFEHSKDDVRKLSSTGTERQTFPAADPWSVAVDADGNVYVVEVPGSLPGTRARVVEFASSGEKILPDKAETEKQAVEKKEGKEVRGFAELHSQDGRLPGLATSSACDIAGADLYVGSYYREERESYVTAYGPPPDPISCPPPVAAPSIADQFASAATPDGATVKATINPHFWPDVTFFVEYGTGACSAGGCPNKLPVGEVALGKRVVDAPVVSPGIFLPSLAPRTTYHFRFVAKSGGGGPVVGTGGTGAEGTFTTPAQPVSPPTPDPCPNSAFRTGPAAFLADCRAYEMVTPVDKENGDIITLFENLSHTASLNQSSLDGDKITYSAYRAFGDAQSAPYTSQYVAARDPQAGWLSHGISPARNFSVLGNIGLDSEFRAFTPNLCDGWLLHDSDPLLAPGAVEHFANIYRSDLCGTEAGEVPFEAFTTAEPQCGKAKAYLPELQGVSEDLGEIVFRARDKLTNNAAACPPLETEPRPFQCYASRNGKLRLLSILPGGATSTLNCSVGTMIQAGALRYTSLDHAVSSDGSRVFWTQSSGGEGSGTLYLRVNPDQAPSKVVGGECTEVAKACTVDVSKAVSGGPALFWTAAADGSKVIFTVGDAAQGQADLYEASFEQVGAHLVPDVQPIAHEVWGLLGASDDASRIYLVSEEALAAGATAGELNLYFYEAGAGARFAAEISRADVTRSGEINGFLSPLSPNPNLHLARVSPDGLHAAFMSKGALTGIDSTDAVSREPDAQVFLFDATATGAEALRCVSCNTTSVRPTGRELVVNLRQSGVWAAAQIPTMESQFYEGHVLADDGSRLFFESYEPLVVRDTNSKQDVYMWETVGHGSCGPADPYFSAPNGGCVSLVSSGGGDQDSELVDASTDGEDVFLATGSSLVEQDPGLIDIYDARVGGGFPPPPAAPPACQGEACQAPASPPSDPTPASATYVGPGNPKPHKKKSKRAHKKKHGKHKKKQHRAGQKGGGRR